MQAQGWPASILHWTSSFLSNRRVQVRYQNGVRSPKKLEYGVPQGFPISPLLFLLYMVELLRSGNPRARFGYADDIGILGIGPTSVESALAAQREVDRLAAHRMWAASISSSDICAYSDGSSEDHGRFSWGFFLQRRGITLKTGQGTLHGGEFYDDELYGATATLEAALSVRENNEKIYVLLDNQAAVLALETGRTSSSLRLTRVFHEVAKIANAHVRWVPGDSRISGNEESEAAARAALQELPPRPAQPGYINLAYLRRLMQQYWQNLIDCWWSTVYPARYKDLGLQLRRRKPQELNLPRLLLQRLIAARSGHGDFAEYHRRFHHENAVLDCACGLEKSPTHFVRYRIHAIHTRKLRKGRIINDFISHLLGPDSHEKFTEFAKTTGCFGNIPAYLFSAGHENSYF
ncbi:hypothetical protein K3495_g2518 [Podosphaera aphanis]|nr:hypothetical protein K3495_g2518 [Podosphaera aphanis]